MHWRWRLGRRALGTSCPRLHLRSPPESRDLFSVLGKILFFRKCLDILVRKKFVSKVLLCYNLLLYIAPLSRFQFTTASVTPRALIVICRTFLIILRILYTTLDSFQVFRQIEVKGFDSNLFETTQIFYSSNDGTKIPMFVVHKKVSIFDKKFVDMKSIIRQIPKSRTCEAFSNIKFLVVFFN